MVFMTEFCFQISNKVLRWVRLIIFVLIFSTLIHFSQAEEQLLFQVYLKAHESNQWGAYNDPPHRKTLYLVEED